MRFYFENDIIYQIYQNYHFKRLQKYFLNNNIDDLESEFICDCHCPTAK